MKKSTARFFKSIGAGIIGAALTLMLGVILFALAKLIYIIARQDLLLSKYAIAGTMFVLAIVGFVLGIIAYMRKWPESMVFGTSWIAILLDFIISALITFIIYLVLKHAFSLLLTSKAMIALFALLFITIYAFSAATSHLATPKRRKPYKTRSVVYLIIFNPLFILAALWLFGLVIYNSLNVPCGVSIMGIEKNTNTANTAYLNIRQGERIVSIDGVAINSLADVRNFMDSLNVTKEVAVETEKSIYYIQTYEKDGRRYMGLILSEAYCPRKY